MRLKNWRIKLGVGLAAMLLATGCVPMMLMSLGGAAAIGSYKWMEGTMEKDYPRSMQDTWNAALAAAKDMSLKIQTQQYGPTESKLEAVAPPDTEAKIQLVARPNQITTVKVRFGLMGNQDASAYFHRRILQHLGLPPT
ncbi:MAG: DUF3568 family protein [Deltaproteobacteria bacterium]|nr:DUF3568 family protein [Deltaproteobacteria bacterium]